MTKEQDRRKHLLVRTRDKKEKWEPPIWRKQLKNMYEMRKNRDAPVDSMGCDVISDVTAKPEVCLQQSEI